MVQPPSRPRLISLISPAATKILTLAGRNAFTCIYNEPSDPLAHSCYALGLGRSGELGTASSTPAASLVPLTGVFFGKSIDKIESMRSTYSTTESYSAAAVFATAEGGKALISWGDIREGKTATGISSKITDLGLSGGAFRHAAATRDAFAFVTRTGVLYTLGANIPPGILGNGDLDSTGSSIPVQVATNAVGSGDLAVASVAALTAGEGFFAALVKTDFASNTDALVVWWGLVPTSPVSTISVPQQVDFGNEPSEPTRAITTRFRLLACGRAHCITRTSNSNPSSHVHLR